MNDYCDLMKHIKEAVDRTLHAINTLQIDTEDIFKKKLYTRLSVVDHW